VEINDPHGDDGGERLATVRQYLPLLPGASGELDRITEVAARTFDAPVAAISLVSDDRVTFVARRGLELTESTIDPGLCATAIVHVGSYILVDARADPRAARHPMVTGEPGVRFYAAVPIMVEGVPLGVVCVMDTRPRTPDPSDLATLRDLSNMAAETLRLRKVANDTIAHEQEARSRAELEVDRLGQIAETLQNSLTPSRLPRIPGLEIAAFYLPFATDEVGGDFFDVFPIDDVRWGMFVGDVVGKGVEAAAFTSLARYSLRAAAVVQPDPASVLSTVNETVRMDPSGDDALYCTVAYGQLIKGPGFTWRATLAVGGHPPPFVVRSTRSVEPLMEGGTIVGSFANERYANTEVDLAPGDTLLMYSDGLTDLPTRQGWLGDEGIKRALEDHPVRSAKEAVDLLRRVITGNSRALRDDLVILAASVPRNPRPDGEVTFTSRRSREGN
jgi:sigma-B regulation protein RsbU (phosphoserine phosphatase)